MLPPQSHPPPREPEPLSSEQVRHVAKLARLRLDEAQVERYRTQLSSVLAHIAKLNELDVENVEPMAPPTPPTTANRLDEDEVALGGTLTVEQVLMNAPAVEDCYLAVPKVLEE